MLTKLSLSLRRECKPDEVRLRIPIGVFVNLIPQELAHEQATRAKAGQLQVFAYDLASAVALFNPHIRTGLGISTTQISPTLPLNITVTQVTPAHISFEVNDWGTLCLRVEEFKPFLEHVRFPVLNIPAHLKQPVAEYTEVYDGQD